MEINEINKWWSGEDAILVSENGDSFVFKNCGRNYGVAYVNWEDEEVHFLSDQHDLVVSFEEIKEG